MATYSYAKSAVFDHFVISADGNHYICQCKKRDSNEQLCEAKLNTISDSKTSKIGKTSNLKRHLLRFHPNIYEIVCKKDSKDNTSAKSIKTFVGQSAPLVKYSPIGKITVTMTSSTFKNSIVQMVVKNSIPISFFSTEAFRSMNGEMAQKFAIRLDSDNIRKMVIEEATRQKQELKYTLKERLLFLKIDGCTQYGINYFAINVRCTNDEKKIMTKTLAVEDTHAQDTSEYLSKVVERVLQDFEIQKRQILCIVTDNAANLPCRVEELNLAAAEDEKSPEVDLSPTTESGTLIDNHEMISEASKLCAIKHTRCAVHTLQLAIRDSLRKPHVAAVIRRARQVVTAAKTPEIDSILKKRSGLGVILDQEMCWESTYWMINRLLKLGVYLLELVNKDIMFSKYEWDELKDLEALLRYPFSATKKFQSEDLTPGSFFLTWKELLYCLCQNEGIIAEELLSSIKMRERVLLENATFLAAIYVDPMSRVFLTEDDQTKAKRALYEVASCVGERDSGDVQNVKDEELILTIPSESSSNPDGFSKYADKLESLKAKRRKVEKHSRDDTEANQFKEIFFAGLKEVEKYNRSTKKNVVEVLPLYPESIRGIARTMTAMPSTQVSCGRLFSALKIINSNLRASMKDDLLDAVLFLRTNME